ncbi:phage tail protein [Pseudomonas iridis]|uniref:phage tail protein n=1 Tax=Pseudomonas iridis TaxID=2710587 RepID=UPI0021C1E660|nr:phage tail protein [Pseudomonas iridis]MCT8948390.1 phage tail protein [Pseudomonas iridis]
MSWYKTGTVAVTQNSNAVIGTGTAFIANSRVGDGFRGPDGRWYEVTNIASNTALSISPNYEGPTAAGGFYSIMPVQGYQKDLSDQVRAILNDYGEKLAALGTTGNYDVLPVSKGGTGGVDQVEGRAGLGLGAAATENIIPVTKGGTGGTDQAGARTGLGLGSVAVENILPVTKGGTGGTSQATARTALGLGSASVAAIVGTVSQTAGTPTGAIIEQGSNANGSYVKFADGTMMSWWTRTGVTLAYGNIFTLAGGNTYYGSAGWTFPVQFTGVPTVTCMVRSTGRLLWACLNNVSAATANFYLLSALNETVSSDFTFIAIGRWF